MGLPAALVLAGIAALVGALAAHRSASRADDWLQTRATIERVDGRNVTYRYEAGGRAQRGTAVSDQTHAAGAPVLVYVDPAEPAQSLLQLPRRPPVWPAFAGALSLLAGLAFGTYFLLHERKSTKAPAPQQQAKGGRKPAPPLSRLRPPPSIKRTAPDTPEP